MTVPLGMRASLITVTIPLLMKYPSVSLAASCTLSLLMICNNEAVPFSHQLSKRHNPCEDKSCRNYLYIVSNTSILVDDCFLDVRVLANTNWNTSFSYQKPSVCISLVSEETKTWALLVAELR